jgi:hypothetical protein
VALQAGQPGLVRRYGERGLDLSRKAGDRVYLLCHEALLGSLDLALGDVAAAADRPAVGGAVRARRDRLRSRGTARPAPARTDPRAA